MLTSYLYQKCKGLPIAALRKGEIFLSPGDGGGAIIIYYYMIDVILSRIWLQLLVIN